MTVVAHLRGDESRYLRGTRDDLPRSGRFIDDLCSDWDYRVSALLAVRIRHNGGRAWATWRAGSFNAAQIMRAGDIARNARLRDVRAWLSKDETERSC